MMESGGCGFGGWTGTGWVGLREECDSMITSYGEEVRNGRFNNIFLRMDLKKISE